MFGQLHYDLQYRPNVSQSFVNHNLRRALLVVTPFILITLILVAYQRRYQPDPRLYFSGPVEWLGNPLAARWPSGEDVFARNIWDLQRFQGRIYMGSGNSANEKPAPNAGPIDIWSYSPGEQRFINEGRVQEQQIDRYKIINGQLHIPGHDARLPDNWDYGNYYFKTPEGWIKRRRIPKGIHLYDLASHDGKLFAALGSHDYSGGLAVSDDRGETWATTPVGFHRLYSLFEFDGELYAAAMYRTAARNAQLQKRFPKHQDDIPLSLFVYRQGKMQPVETGLRAFFPGWPYPQAKLRHPTPYRQGLVYTAAQPGNDHHYREQTLYVMNQAGESRKLHLPQQLTPQDILIDGERLLILATRQGEGQWAYKNVVLASTDLKTWDNLLEFDADTFARAFEYLDGCFYFGMGDDLKAAKQWWSGWRFSPLTGALLKSRCDFQT